MSSDSTRPNKYTLGSNPWIFLNPNCANALLIIFVGFVLIIDLSLISIHWNISSCSKILKLWIIGKYFAPLISYLSCCLFVPCNLDETMDISTAIPYSQHIASQQRMQHHIFTNPISQIRREQQRELITTTTMHTNNDENNIKTHTKKEKNYCCCMNIPYPFDILLSEWFISPSTITSNIAESMEEGSWCCKCYVYFIGMIFDRGILELLWLLVGGLSLISQENACRYHTPILFYYVLLQIILGTFITLMLILWMISSSMCPLQVARLMACCYGMQCDILGLLPKGLFNKLLTMHNIYYAKNKGLNYRNYHTLSTIPHSYAYDGDDTSEDAVDLITTNANDHDGKSERKMCGMCNHWMDCVDNIDSIVLDCGHEFHSVCCDAWPIGLECPHCLTMIKEEEKKMKNHENIQIEPSDISNCRIELSKTVQPL